MLWLSQHHKISVDNQATHIEVCATLLVAMGTRLYYGNHTDRHVLSMVYQCIVKIVSEPWMSMNGLLNVRLTQSIKVQCRINDPFSDIKPAVWAAF